MAKSEKSYARADVADFANIPQALRDTPQWECWKLIVNRKVPIDPTTGKAYPKGPDSDEMGRGTFSQACELFENRRDLMGIGFRFKTTDQFCGYDLDDVRDPATGALSPWAADVVSWFGAYAEVSPSGTGVKGFFIGHLSKNVPDKPCHDGKMALFSNNKYFAVTGQRLPETGTEMVDAQAATDHWYKFLTNGSQPKAGKAVAAGDDKIPKGAQDNYLISRAGGYRRLGDTAETIEQKLLIDYHERCAPPHDNEQRVREIARGSMRYEAGEEPTVFRQDVANAALFAEMHKGHVIYCRDRRIWFAWDGRRFAADNLGEVMRRARDTVRALYEDAIKEPGDDEHQAQRKAKLKRALIAESRLEKIVGYAASERALEVMKFDDTFDLDPFLLNCANGILDLRTGELRPHETTARMTKITEVACSAVSECPKFERWLIETCGGNEGLKAYLLRLMGYCLSGLTEEQSFWMFYGPTKTGKSTFVKILRRLLGEYATSLSESAVVVNHVGNPEHALAELANVRVATLVEIAEGKRYDEAKLKQITGQDWIGASKKYQNYFEFMSKAKLVIAVNHRPVVRETDDAFWNRVKPVPFLVFVPPEKRIAGLDEMLMEEEGPGIMALAAENFRRWRQDGLDEPPEVSNATAEYRTEQDLVANFIEECCVKNPAKKETYKYLFEEFLKWKERNGVRRTWTKNQFGRELERLGYSCKKSGEWFWWGLCLNGQSQMEI